MAEILDELNAAKTAAMKAKIAAGSDDEKLEAGVRLGVIRTLIGEVEKDSKLENPRGDLAVLKSELKKRNETAALFRKSGKDSHAFKELAEARVVEEFLPKEPDAGELESFIAKVIKDKKLQGAGGKGIGQVMGELKGAFESYNGKTASEIARKLLA